MTSKAMKYKEQTEALQETIQEHIQVQEEMRAKIKAESKANAGQISDFQFSERRRRGGFREDLFFQNFHSRAKEKAYLKREKFIAPGIIRLMAISRM